MISRRGILENKRQRSRKEDGPNGGREEEEDEIKGGAGGGFDHVLRLHVVQPLRLRDMVGGLTSKSESPSTRNPSDDDLIVCRAT